jgi:hypothetical protein
MRPPRCEVVLSEVRRAVRWGQTDGWPLGCLQGWTLSCIWRVTPVPICEDWECWITAQDFCSTDQAAWTASDYASYEAPSIQPQATWPPEPITARWPTPRHNSDTLAWCERIPSAQERSACLLTSSDEPASGLSSRDSPIKSRPKAIIHPFAFLPPQAWERQPS